MQNIPPQQRFQLLVNQSVDYAAIIMDSDGTIVEWSPGAEVLLGWTAHEAIGQPSAMIFTREDREAGAARAELHTALALGHAADIRWHVRKDGSAVFCDGTVSKLLGEDGKTVAGFGKIMRKAYPAAGQDRAGGGGAAAGNGMAGQRSFLAATLESVENGIIACDRQGKLTFFNAAAQRIHGLAELPLSFERWGNHYHMYRPDGVTPLSIEEVPLYRALKGEQVVQAPLVVLAGDGAWRHVRVTGMPLRDSAGQIQGAVISMNEVAAPLAAAPAAAAGPLARLDAAEEQLRLVAEAAELGIWTWDVREDRVTWNNPRMNEILNVPAGAETVNAARLMADYLHGDDVDAFRAAAARAVDDGGRFEFTGRFRRLPEPGLRWLELRGVVKRGRDGAVLIVGTAADLTERKRNEDALKDTRLRLEATLSSAEIATWIWDVANDRIIADRNLNRLFGLPDDLAPGAPFSAYTKVIHPDDRDEVARQIGRALDTRAPYSTTYRIVRPDGSLRWVNARGRVEESADGQAAIMAGVTLDITPQKEIQDVWRVTEERYRTLIASMDEAFGIVQVIVDEAGTPVDYRFEQVNRALEQQSGLVNAVGRTIREMVPDIEPHWIEIYGRVALTREPARFVEHSAAMGYWWDVYATPMGAPEERRIAILFTDITARKQAEESLRQVAADLSEANRRKTEFLATLAHELRNPLAPMRTGLDLIRMAGRSAQGAHAAGGKVLDMMDRQLKQMVHLIDDLMDVSRINSGKIVLKKDVLDLRDGIAGAVEALLPAIEAAHHELHVDMPGQPILVDADATRLAQILGNLFTNAVKYTPNGGRITVSARVEGDAAAVAVTDTGVGIPLEEQAEVFEMFSQVSKNMGRAQGGLGIGLSLVRSLVEMHGGTIGVESRGAGAGTTFTVTLPLAGAALAAAEAAPEHAEADDAAGSAGPARSLRIVVADDNVDAANTLARLLRAAGHTAEAVHDGLQAVRTIVVTRPDLAILDIGMPGLNGYEAAEKIRATPGLEGLMLIALTGWGGDLDRYRSKKAGFDAHLTKPAGLDDIRRLVGNLGGAARTAGS